MSQQNGQPGPGDEPAWTPPGGWSEQQPPAWGAGPDGPTQPGGPGQSAPVWPGQSPPVWPGAPHPGPPQGAWPQQGAAGSGAPAGHPTPPPGAWPQPPTPPPGWQQPPGEWQQVPPPPGWQQPGWGGYQSGPPSPWGPLPQAPKPGIVPLRPLGVGELLDGALGLIRSNPRTVLGLAAAISSVSALLQTLGLWASLSLLGSMDSLSGAAGGAEADGAALIAVASAQIVPAIMASFLQLLASGLFIVLVAAAVLGVKLDSGASWRLLRPRFLALIGLTLLVAVAGVLLVSVVAGAIALIAVTIGAWAIVPGIVLIVLMIAAAVFVYVRLAVSAPALVIEGHSPIAAMRRSWALVRGTWWRVLGILLLSAIITNLLAAVVAAPLGFVAGLMSGFSDSLAPTVLASGLGTLISGIIVLPFSAAVTGLLYTDLRMRREALDIDLVTAGMEPNPDPLAAYRRRLG